MMKKIIKNKYLLKTPIIFKKICIKDDLGK